MHAGGGEHQLRESQLEQGFDLRKRPVVARLGGIGLHHVHSTKRRWAASIRRIHPWLSTPASDCFGSIAPARWLSREWDPSGEPGFGNGAEIRGGRRRG